MPIWSATNSLRGDMAASMARSSERTWSARECFSLSAASVARACCSRVSRSFTSGWRSGYSDICGDTTSADMDWLKYTGQRKLCW